MRTGDSSYDNHLSYISKFWLSRPECHVSNPYGCTIAQNAPGFWNVIGAAWELRYFV